VNISRFLDLASHDPDSTEEKIRDLCDKVRQFGFNAAFVNPCYILLAKSLGVKVGTVVSFPLGQETLPVKTGCAESYARLGADELDVSLNVGLIKEGRWAESLGEMKAVIQAAKSINDIIIIKFIPETGFLAPDEIRKTAEIMADSGADFFKTCSGMGPRGATIEDVKLVREAIEDRLKIKVAGGITTLEQAREFINAGADRIGTSHAVEIITGENTDATERRIPPPIEDCLPP
jgi:deoxyribose-phosphate aldolase